MDLMEMFRQIWLFWVSLFTDNPLIGSKQSTALMALIILVPVIGWLLKELFGRDPGVR